MTQADVSKHSVALVLDPNFGEEALLLARRMPLWIVSSSANDLVVERARNEGFKEGQITQLLELDGESLRDLLARAVYSIDEHHSEASQVVAYNTLHVY